MNNFSVNDQFKLYLEKTGQDPKKMLPIQYQEVKRAFFASAGQILLLMRDELTKLPDKAADAKIKDMIDQVGLFWVNEVEQSKRP